MLYQLHLIILMGLIYLGYVTFRKKSEPSAVEYNILGIGVRAYVLALVVQNFTEESSISLVILAGIAGAIICVAQVSLVQSAVHSFLNKRYFQVGLDIVGLLMILFVVLASTASVVESTSKQHSDVNANNSDKVKYAKIALDTANNNLSALTKKLSECPADMIKNCTMPLNNSISQQRVEITRLTNEFNATLNETKNEGGGSGNATVRLAVKFLNLNLEDASMKVSIATTLILELFGLIMHISAALKHYVDDMKGDVTPITPIKRKYVRKKPLTARKKTPKKKLEVKVEENGEQFF